MIRETHETPECVAELLVRAGGLNRFGEPNFRAVWGWNRLDWIGGKWEDRDPATGELIREVVELRRAPKYHAVNRWHIERWCPPEMYGSPAAWHAQTLEVSGAHSIAALGPYPARGDYELALTLEGPSRNGKPGEFVQLTPAIAEAVARVIEFSRGLPRRARRNAIAAREARADRAFDAAADEILSS